MTLRARLSVTSVLVALPLAIGLFLLDERVRLGAMEESLRQVIETEVGNNLLDRCVASDGRFRPAGALAPPRPFAGGGRRRGAGPAADGPRGGGPGARGRGGIEIFAYDERGRPARADAPALPSQPTSTFVRSVVEGRGIQIIFPLGGQGVCAQGLARLPARLGQTRDQLVAVALALFSALGAAWVAAGPAIARLRRLAESVRAAGAAQYRTPIRLDGRDEVSELARAFNDAGEQVRGYVGEVHAREETLRQFVANTTHDIAVPLTVLQGHLAALDQRLPTFSAGADVAGHVRAAMKESHYLASLLRNLGAATKLGEAGAPLHTGDVDLSALVERVVMRHGTIARASEVELNMATPEQPLVVSTDATLMEQAVGNLVDNAVRYNRAGGHVAVVVDRSGDCGFVLSVTDDGPGVVPEEIGKLTERWFRGSDARTRRPDGSGLGLAIASESVARLGFSLTFATPDAGGLRAEIRGEERVLESSAKTARR